MIEEIQAREKAAGDFWVSTSRAIPREGVGAVALVTELDKEDFVADFIAHAREDIPYLLAQLRDREATLEAIEKAAVSHGYSQAKAFMDAVDRILKGGE